MGLFAPAWYEGAEESPAGGAFHYTTGKNLRRIIADGVIKPHRAMPGDRAPLVWFSTNGIWEPAANRPTAWNKFQPMAFGIL